MTARQPLPLLRVGLLAALTVSLSPTGPDIQLSSSYADTNMVASTASPNPSAESRLFLLVAIAVCVVVFGGVIAFGVVAVRRGGCKHPSSEKSFSDVADEPGGPAAAPAEQAEPSQAGTSVAAEDPPPGSIFLRLV